MRPSESQREKTIRVLREGCTAGRLSPFKLEYRVERALAARGSNDLHHLTVDLQRAARFRAWLLQPTSHGRYVAPEEASLWLDGLGQRPFVIGRSREATFTSR